MRPILAVYIVISRDGFPPCLLWGLCFLFVDMDSSCQCVCFLLISWPVFWVVLNRSFPCRCLQSVWDWMRFDPHQLKPSDRCSVFNYLTCVLSCAQPNISCQCLQSVWNWMRFDPQQLKTIISLPAFLYSVMLRLDFAWVCIFVLICNLDTSYRTSQHWRVYPTPALTLKMIGNES